MKKLQTLSRILLVSALTFVAAQAIGQTVTLVNFPMEGTSTADILNPASHAASITVSSIASHHEGKLGNTGSGGFLRLTLATTQGRATPSLPDALADQDYFSFTLTPDAGQKIDLTKIAFRAAAGGAATPRSFYLFSSIDGFEASHLLLSGSTDAGAQPLTTTLADYTFSFTGSQYRDITTPITFRFYVQSKDIGQTILFDDIRVEGSVSAGAIPEPAAVVMLAGLAALAAAWMSRRICQNTAAR